MLQRRKATRQDGVALCNAFIFLPVHTHTCVLRQMQFGGGCGVCRVESSLSDLGVMRSKEHRGKGKEQTCILQAISSSESLGMALRRMLIVPHALSLPLGCSSLMLSPFWLCASWNVAVT